MSRLSDRTARRTEKVRRAIKRAAGSRVRLSVFRSSKHIYAQVIDDTKGETVASASYPGEFTIFFMSLPSGVAV